MITKIGKELVQNELKENPYKYLIPTGIAATGIGLGALGALLCRKGVKGKISKINEARNTVIKNRKGQDKKWERIQNQSGSISKMNKSPTFDDSVNLARSHGVPENTIIHNVEELDQFMNSGKPFKL